MKVFISGSISIKKLPLSAVKKLIILYLRILPF